MVARVVYSFSACPLCSCSLLTAHFAEGVLATNMVSEAYSVSLLWWNEVFFSLSGAIRKLTLAVSRTIRVLLQQRKLKEIAGEKQNKAKARYHGWSSRRLWPHCRWDRKIIDVNTHKRFLLIFATSANKTFHSLQCNPFFPKPKATILSVSPTRTRGMNGRVMAILTEAKWFCRQK